MGKSVRAILNYFILVREHQARLRAVYLSQRRPLEKGFRVGVYWFGYFLRPVMSLAFLCLCFCLVYFYFMLRDDVRARTQLQHRAQALLQNWHLESYPDKIKKMGQITTRNAKYTVLRDNMERLRLMLETYPTENKDYPPNIDALYQQASNAEYWLLTRNPLTGATDSYHHIVADYRDYEFSWQHAKYKGMVLYRPEGRGYHIYACDEKGKLVENLSGVFTISNPGQ